MMYLVRPWDDSDYELFRFYREAVEWGNTYYEGCYDIEEIEIEDLEDYFS